MGYVFYVFGVLGLLLALYMGTIGAPVDPMARAFAWTYTASLVGASIGLFAIGRVLDLLAQIARNTESLRSFGKSRREGRDDRVEPKP
ncbi:hypothetical protein [Devosia chinhatensis]|uniref:Uncharacterized protein n=1 Tax=Devosia chinhatensis TaxID=429727 RepID=A0A0F5FKI3_9HYPH|nr:hypothetical protein [Devosia chinhatensis]KKB09409.1 hypothetical protein VE26_05595 [Devosia chinhatensis]